MTQPLVHYQVFIKVPFNRGDFVDPPDPNWNSAKDKELWRILSSASKGKDIDWHGLADKFDVTLAFLLQQAAWLYERQLSQVREQLRRVNKPSLSANASPSPPPDSATTSTAGTGPQAMKRGPSIGQSGLGRPSSNLTLRTKTSGEVGRNSPAASPVQERPQRGMLYVTSSANEQSDVVTVAAFSRTTSANTITQLQKSSLSPVVASGSGPKSPIIDQDSVIRRPQVPASRQPLSPTSPTSPSPKASPSPSESSSSDDDDGVPSLAQSRAFQRRPRFSSILAKGKSKVVSGRNLDSVANDNEDSSDSDEGFLPFATAPTSQTARPLAKSTATSGKTGSTSRVPVQTRTAATAHAAAQRTPRPSYDGTSPRPAEPDPASNSGSASPSSAAASVSHSSQGASSHPSLPPSDHRLALAALSPRQRRSVARDGSDTGTPSMGSSFSDLDDASVSMSAMEEALAQQMRGGNAAGVTGAGAVAASALRGSLAVGMGMWRGVGGGGNGSQGASGAQGRGQGR